MDGLLVFLCGFSQHFQTKPICWWLVTTDLSWRSEGDKGQRIDLAQRSGGRLVTLGPLVIVLGIHTYTYTHTYIYMIKCLNIEDKTKALQKRRMTILHFNALIWSYVVFPKFFTMDLLLFVLRLRTKTYPTAGFQGLSSLQTHTEDFCGSDMKTLLNNGKYMIYGCIWKWGIPSCKWHQFW